VVTIYIDWRPDQKLHHGAGYGAYSSLMRRLGYTSTYHFIVLHRIYRTFSNNL
jgi:hypothetical protein